jgi:hypothetical protein
VAGLGTRGRRHDAPVAESGFIGPAKHADNTQGWDVEVLRNLVRLVDGWTATA